MCPGSAMIARARVGSLVGGSCGLTDGHSNDQKEEHRHGDGQKDADSEEYEFASMESITRRDDGDFGGSVRTCGRRDRQCHQA